MIQSHIRTSNYQTRSSKVVKYDENDSIGGFETPKHVEETKEREATTATFKKNIEWNSSEDESFDYEDDEELKMFQRRTQKAVSSDLSIPKRALTAYAIFVKKVSLFDCKRRKEL